MTQLEDSSACSLVGVPRAVVVALVRSAAALVFFGGCVAVVAVTVRYCVNISLRAVRGVSNPSLGVGGGSSATRVRGVGGGGLFGTGGGDGEEDEAAAATRRGRIGSFDQMGRSNRRRRSV